MIVLVDQDGPLANFERGFLENWRAQFPNELWIPPEQRTTFYPREQYPRELRDKVESIYFAQGFYLNLPPVDGAVEAIREIMRLGHDVRICTSPLSRYENCVLEKYQWVERHLGRDFIDRIFLAKDKTFIRGDILIDDNPWVRGVCEPAWEHIVFDLPFNRNVASKRRISWSNWKEVLGS